MNCEQCGVEIPQALRRCALCEADFLKSVRERVDEARSFVERYKKMHACVGFQKPCPYPHEPEILQFDHVNGEKEFDVSTGVARGISVLKLKSEIKKCVVRCPNCHMLKTNFERKHQIRWEENSAPKSNQNSFAPRIIDGVLSRGDICKITGPKAVGKTFLAWNLIASIASGERFLCFDTFRRDNILLLDHNNHANTFVAFSRAIETEQNVDPYKNLWCVFARDDNSLLDWIKPEMFREYDVVVLDSPPKPLIAEIQSLKTDLDIPAIIFIGDTDLAESEIKISRFGDSQTLDLEISSKRFGRQPLTCWRFEYPHFTQEVVND